MRSLTALLTLIPLVLFGCGKSEETADTGSGEKSDTQLMMDLADANPDETMGVLGLGPGSDAMDIGAGDLGDFGDMGALGGGAGAMPAPVPVHVGGVAGGRTSAAPTPRPEVTLEQMTEDQAAAVEAAERYREAAQGHFPAYEQVTEVVSGNKLRLATLGLAKLKGVNAPREAEPGQHEGWMLLSDLVQKQFVWVESYDNGEVQIVLPQPYAVPGEPAFIDINATMNACLADLPGAAAYYGQRAPWKGPHLVPVTGEALDKLNKRQSTMQAAIKAEQEAERARMAAEAAM